MNIAALALAALTFLSATASAQYTRAEAAISPDGSDSTLHLYLFDQRRTTLKIIDQGGLEGQKFKDLNAAMTTMNCVAGCNGGFFGPDGKPLGLVIADGKTSGTRNTASSLTSGVLFLDGSNIRIQRSQTYFQKSGTPPRQLLQTGPFLVENSRTVSGLSDRKFARRTFILTDGENRWAIGYSPATTLHRLSKALANPKTFPNFNVTAALNLDGGSSSGLWIKRDHHPFYLKEIKNVRNFLGLVRR